MMFHGNERDILQFADDGSTNEEIIVVQIKFGIKIFSTDNCSSSNAGFFNNLVHIHSCLEVWRWVLEMAVRRK